MQCVTYVSQLLHEILQKVGDSHLLLQSYRRNEELKQAEGSLHPSKVGKQIKYWTNMINQKGKDDTQSTHRCSKVYTSQIHIYGLLYDSTGGVLVTIPSLSCQSGLCCAILLWSIVTCAPPQPAFFPPHLLCICTLLIKNMSFHNIIDFL